MTTTTVTRKIGQNRGKARLWIEGTALYYPSTFTLELFGYDDRRDFLDSLRDPIAHARIDSTDELDDITIHTVTLSDEIPTSLGLTCA